jgi:hypothetical protein
VGKEKEKWYLSEGRAMVFKKGESGNVFGKPRDFRKDFLAAVRKNGLFKRSLEVLEKNLSSPEKKGGDLDAAMYIFNQCLGKAPQPIKMDEKSGSGVVVVINTPRPVREQLSAPMTAKLMEMNNPREKEVEVQYEQVTTGNGSEGPAEIRDIR